MKQFPIIIATAAELGIQSPTTQAKEERSWECINGQFGWFNDETMVDLELYKPGSLPPFWTSTTA